MRFTSYLPSVLYTWDGLSSVDVNPSPKSHRREVITPEDASVKTTVNGYVPDKGVPENPATGATALTVIVYACEPLKVLASVAVMVKVDVPAAVGVPEMVSPVSVRPAGKVPAVTV